MDNVEIAENTNNMENTDNANNIKNTDNMENITLRREYVISKKKGKIGRGY